MPDIYVEGTYKLNGKIKIQGSKNAVLPIIAATVLVDGKSVIKNCPDLLDVKASMKILKHLGAKCRFFENTLMIDSTGVSKSCVPENLMREMRSSSLFLGAILARTGSAQISSPGGCELGPRPIDLHIKALKSLGALVNEEGGNIRFSLPDGLKGNEIHLSFPSVGATENAILAAALAKGTTVIYNAAREPEIVDLANFINSCGGKIVGAGNDKVTVLGVKKLNGAEYSVAFDRIVAASYISAAAVTSGDIVMSGTDKSQLSSVISVFNEAGCRFGYSNDEIRVTAPKKLGSVSTVRSLTYPAFPTDAGPMFISAMSYADGTTIFVENIFQNRFRYIDELKRLGASVKTEGKVAVIVGKSALYGANCVATDLRGGAALVVAGLGATGITKIGEIHHIKRGYEDIVRDLSLLGAKIKEE